MNNDLISRSELKKAVDTWDKFGYTAKRELIRLTEENKDLYVPYVKFDDVCYCIDNTPTVDINTELSVAYLKGRRQGQSEGRPQGEWLNFDDGSVACPICGTGTSIKSIPSVIFFRYCPYCGARLKGGAE